MYSLEEVDESNRQRVVEFLRKDAVRHVFALYDIRYEPYKHEDVCCF